MRTSPTDGSRLAVPISGCVSSKSRIASSSRSKSPGEAVRCFPHEREIFWIIAIARAAIRTSNRAIYLRRRNERSSLAETYRPARISAAPAAIAASSSLSSLSSRPASGSCTNTVSLAPSGSFARVTTFPFRTLALTVRTERRYHDHASPRTISSAADFE